MGISEEQMRRKDVVTKWVQIKLVSSSEQDRAILEYKEKFYPRLSMPAFFLELAQRAADDEKRKVE